MNKKRILVLILFFLVACSSNKGTEYISNGPLISTYETKIPITETIIYNAAKPTLTKIEKPSITPYTLRICVDVNSLKIREYPRTNYKPIGYILKGECINILGVSKDYQWVKIENGWIGANFVKYNPEFYNLPVLSDYGSLSFLATTSTPRIRTIYPTKTAPQINTPTQKYVPYIRPTNTPAPANNTSTIFWNEAKFHIGEKRTVCGTVVDSYFGSSTNGQPTFLNLGKKYSETGKFTVVIWGRNLNNFTQSPATYYLEKNICVYGLIESYKGEPELEVTTPKQITVY